MYRVAERGEQGSGRSIFFSFSLTSYALQWRLGKPLLTQLINLSNMVHREAPGFAWSNKNVQLLSTVLFTSVLLGMLL